VTPHRVTQETIAIRQPIMARGPSSGFRANTGRMCEMMPKPRQDRDVHLGVAEEPEQVLPQQGEPPACGWSRSLITSPRE